MTKTELNENKRRDSICPLSDNIYLGTPKNLREAVAMLYIFRIMQQDVLFDLKYLTAPERSGFEELDVWQKPYTQEIQGLFFIRNKKTSVLEFAYTKFPDIHKALEKLSVKMLETMAALLQSSIRLGGYLRSQLVTDCPDYQSCLEHAYLQNMIIYERMCKLRKTFQFTPENIARLQKANELFISAFAQAKTEMAAQLAQLDRRIAQQDPFLQDYNIEARVTPFFQETQDADVEGFDKVLQESLHRTAILNVAALSSAAGDRLSGFEPYLKSGSPIIEGCQIPELDGIEFSYALHELTEHTGWLGLQDILRIKELWIEVVVEHQHFVEKICLNGK
jgi:hypothetical protein